MDRQPIKNLYPILLYPHGKMMCTMAHIFLPVFYSHIGQLRKIRMDNKTREVKHKTKNNADYDEPTVNLKGE